MYMHFCGEGGIEVGVCIMRHCLVLLHDIHVNVAYDSLYRSSEAARSRSCARAPSTVGLAPPLTLASLSVASSRQCCTCLSVYQLDRIRHRC